MASHPLSRGEPSLSGSFSVGCAVHPFLTRYKNISEFAWIAVSGIKVVPIMAQVAASGFTIRWRDVPKIVYTNNGTMAAYRPTTGSKPNKFRIRMAVGNATPRPIRRPPHHAAAIPADISANFAAPAPPAGREASFCVRWAISPFTLAERLRRPPGQKPVGAAPSQWLNKFCRGSGDRVAFE